MKMRNDSKSTMARYSIQTNYAFETCFFQNKGAGNDKVDIGKCKMFTSVGRSPRITLPPYFTASSYATWNSELKFTKWEAAFQKIYRIYE